jgi:ABC-type nitrate/sulfonate/bicarbonate transport system substrate-binding protein
MKKTGVNLLLSLAAATSIVLVGCTPNSSEDKQAGLTISGICGSDIPTDNLVEISIGLKRIDEPVIAWGSKHGCFAKNGLKVTPQIIEGAEAVAAISSDSIQVMASPLGEAITYFANGGFEAKIIAPISGYSQASIDRAKNPPLYPGKLLLQSAIFAKSDSGISGLEDFRGLTIGANSLTGTGPRALYAALASVGISQDEYSLIEIPTENIQTAIETDQVDAGIISGRFATLAAESGLNLVLYPGAYAFSAGPTGAWITSASAIEKHSKSIEAFATAVREINRYLANPENEESWKEVLVSELEFDLETAESTLIPEYWTQEITYDDLARFSAELLKSEDISLVPDLRAMLEK